MDSRATNTRVIGRRVSDTLELGFRGTVTEDASGVRSSANWSTNLEPLQEVDQYVALLIVYIDLCEIRFCTQLSKRRLKYRGLLGQILL